MAPKDEGYVTFLNAAGEVISNDPRFHAKRLLEQAGESQDAANEELYQELDAARQVALDKDEEIAALRRKLEELSANPPAGVEDDAEEDDDADDEDEFTSMNGKELKAYAKEHQVDISGMTKVGEVRTALRAAKAAAE